MTISNAVVIFGALPMGRLADRYDRVRLSRAVAVLWAAGSVLVGVSPVLAVLVVGRLLGGLGRIAVEPLHAALLADFYPGPTRPRVYAVHRLAAFLGLVGAPIGALIAAVAGGPEGWRWAFGFLALPTLVLIGVGRRLGDPGRHGSVLVEPMLVEPVSVEPAAPLGVVAALRVLAGLRTLRRLWLAALLFGAGAASLPIFIGLFADEALHLHVGARSALNVGLGVAGLGGLALSSRYASRAVARRDIPHLATLTGAAVAASGVALIVAAPLPRAASLVALLAAGLFAESFFPAYLPLVAEVAPARLRSQAYASIITAVGIGAIGIGIQVGALADRAGSRVALAVLGGCITLGGLVVMSAKSAVAHDLSVAAGIRSQAGGSWLRT